MKNILRYLLAGVCILTLQLNTQAQTKKDEQKAEERMVVKNAMDTRNYTFIAQSMIPMSGMMRQLTGLYDLTVSDNKVVSFLPYMGRIYMPMIDPVNDGPLRFTSKDFTYNANADSKKGWTISIKPNDVRSVREFTLNVQDNGRATLQVMGNDRQPITFYGYIETTV
ncbi:MAG: DUF4251 domain-containing protein [Bacteroidetes bacterium]|nr:DUF4251 domain-containing protein [Bacteroidota bacterium]